MTGVASTFGRRWKPLLIAAAVAVLAAYLAGEHRRVSEIQVASTKHASQTNINELRSRVDETQRQVEGLQQHSAAVTAERFDAANEQLVARLAEVERVAKLAAPAADAVKTLDDRVRELTEQIESARRSSEKTRTAGRRPIPQATPTPTVPDPPFTPLTIENRGGEQFLVILPAGSQSVADARLLRAGDTEQDWLLLRLGARVAEFRIDGQLRRVALP